MEAGGHQLYLLQHNSTCACSRIDQHDHRHTTIIIIIIIDQQRAKPNGMLVDQTALESRSNTTFHQEKQMAEPKWIDGRGPTAKNYKPGRLSSNLHPRLAETCAEFCRGQENTCAILIEPQPLRKSGVAFSHWLCSL